MDSRHDQLPHNLSPPTIKGVQHPLTAPGNPILGSRVCRPPPSNLPPSKTDSRKVDLPELLRQLLSESEYITYKLSPAKITPENCDSFLTKLESTYHNLEKLHGELPTWEERKVLDPKYSISGGLMAMIVELTEEKVLDLFQAMRDTKVIATETRDAKEDERKEAGQSQEAGKITQEEQIEDGEVRLDQAPNSRQEQDTTKHPTSKRSAYRAQNESQTEGTRLFKVRKGRRSGDQD